MDNSKTVAERIVGFLPASLQPYAKTLVAALLAVGTIVSVANDAPLWVTIAFAALSAPVVFGAPNLDPKAEKQEQSVMPPEAGEGAVDLLLWVVVIVIVVWLLVTFLPRIF